MNVYEKNLTLNMFPGSYCLTDLFLCIEQSQCKPELTPYYNNTGHGQI